jgi:Do/DeqQ family serine protease
MLRRTALAILLVLAGFVAGLVLTGRMRSASEGVAAQPARTANTPGAAAASQPPAAPGLGLPDFSVVAGRAVGGVVSLSAVSIVRTSNSPFANDPIFRQFFGESDEWFGSRLERSPALGSGVIISSDGYVVTNNHVVAGNVREITAVLPDKREVKGELVGRDPMTDIAVVKIAARSLPVLPWADSSKLRVGQWVLAVGSPFALDQTVTLGIVSAVGRTGMGLTDYEDFIQTDAAINRGNSGGGLVDARGEVVGINTAIVSEGGGSNGVGFAVSSNLARRIADELIKYGEVRRGSIGAVTVQTLTPEIAAQLEYQPATRGAVVAGMTRTSSAYQAGLRIYDVVVACNGQKIETGEQFVRAIADSPIGSTASIDVLRQGRKTALKVPVTGRNPKAR